VAYAICLNPTRSFTAFPAGYTQLALGGNFDVAIYAKESTAASEDPGAFTINDSASWRAWSLAIRGTVTVEGEIEETAEASFSAQASVTATGALTETATASASAAATVTASASIAETAAPGFTVDAIILGAPQISIGPPIVTTPFPIGAPLVTTPFPISEPTVATPFPIGKPTVRSTT
jgi:hypothetical protein